MSVNYFTTQLYQQFKSGAILSKTQLLSFYKTFDPTLNEATFRWRIHQLKEDKIITPISKGTYLFGYKPIYIPYAEAENIKLYLKLKKQFPGMQQSIWTSNNLNEFMQHQPDLALTILETEPDALEPVYHYLKDTQNRPVFFQPVEKEVTYYISESKKPIILLPLVSKSPLQHSGKIMAPSLEKIIVDVYCNRLIFSAYQGSEYTHILNYAYNHYSLDLTRLFSYAKRRRKDAELKEYFINTTDIPQEIIP